MKTMPASHPTRRLAIASLVALVAGCGSFLEQPAPPALYDLGPLPPDGIAPGGTSDQPPVVLPAIATAGGLDGTAILYRLAYDNAQSLHPYARARWSASAPQLIHERLATRLARTRPVTAPGQLTAAQPPGRAPLVVRLRLQEFAQHFDAPGRSHGVLRMQATALRAGLGGDQLLAQRSFRIARPAATPDAPGGARALAEAVDELASQLDAWLATVPA